MTANYFKRIEGRKQCQKAVFLLKEYHKIDFTYPFIPYLYGPYSSQLQNDIDILGRTGYLKASKYRNIVISCEILPKKLPNTYQTPKLLEFEFYNKQRMENRY